MKYIISFTFLIISLFAYGQNAYQGKMNSEDMVKDAVFKGLVIDDYYKTPVQFANIALLSIQDSTVAGGAVCDENGYFEMNELAYGKYYAIVDFIGYEKYILNDITFNPKQKMLDAGTIYLKHIAVDIEEVEITGERNFVEYKIDKKVINISKNINAAGGSLVDALENAPSIQVDIDGNVSMRGSSNFKVLIDGKPTVLDANDILQQIPPSSVENIEIITNPSVKYDPDGTTGILNIIMKKDHKSGLSGVINASAGTGDKYSTDFLFNYRTKKANFFVGANYGDRTHAGDGYSLRKTYQSEDTSYLYTDFIRDHRRNYYSIKAGADLYLNDNNTLSVGGRFGHFGFGMGTTTENHEYTYLGDVDIYSLNEGTYEVGGDFFSGNIDFIHNFVKEGHELSASVNYSGRLGGNESGTKETLTDENFNLTDNFSEYRTFQDRSSIGWRFNLDYVLPVSEKLKFESGYQTRLRDAGGDYTYENLLDNQWVENDTFTNELIFTREIHSVYTSISGELFGIGYMAGIRGEYTNRLIDQRTTGERYPVERFDFFPSIHLSKELPKSQQVQLSYSRRIERPRHWYLNPFPGYADAYSVRIGNPGLLPEYIDSYELSYQKRIKQSFVNLEGYFRNKTNNINRVQELMDDGRLLMTFDNLDKEYSFGTELSGNIMIQKWWTIYANANFYKYNVEGDIAGITTKDESINYDFRMNTTFMFSKTSRLQLSGFYNGPTVTAQGEREEFWFAGAAFRQEFFKRKLSMTINVRDIFKTGKHTFISSGDGFITENEMRRESPVFTLSLSYKINNYKQNRGEKDSDMNDMDEGGMM